MFCKNCGKEINDTARFCRGCGAKVEQKPDSLVCPACGAHVKIGVKFCEDCGTALDGGRPGVLSPAPAPQSGPEPAPAPVSSSAPAQGTAAAASSYCRACGASLKADIKFCTACGAAVNRPSAPALKPLPLPKRVPAGGAAPVVTATVTSATITDGAPVATPMRKPEVGRQQTPGRASDRLKQQAGTAARQVAKTVFQKILEIETPASGMPGETRTTLNSEQMSALSTVARSLFRR